MDNPIWMENVVILLGNHEKSITEILTSIIEDALCNDVSIIVESHSDEIEERAQEKHIDIIVPVLNNIMYQSIDESSGSRCDQMLDLVTNLKRTTDAPIIALAGWPDDPDFESEVIKARASYFFKMPFNPELFIEAIENCLKSNIK